MKRTIYALAVMLVTLVVAFSVANYTTVRAEKGLSQRVVRLALQANDHKIDVVIRNGKTGSYKLGDATYTVTPVLSQDESAVSVTVASGKGSQTVSKLWLSKGAGPRLATHTPALQVAFVRSYEVPED